ncbi:glycosyltransferase [Geotalea sp. SG265]|uniref:glycosyltransferase n=1 Tax=Geotalea sp. SG265 TaxID=2922867 RepID=UPI001FAFE8D4|nr:glycosyltransferase [Geotalea sp. SG265]
MIQRREREKLKVLHMIASPGIGGAERLLLTLAGALDRERFELVIAMYVGLDLDRDALWNEAKKLDVLLEPITIRSPFDYRQLGKIKAIMCRHRPHIIHTHGYKTNILGLLFARLFGAATVSTVHGWLHAERVITRMLGQMNMLCLRHFSSVIAVSDEIRLGLEKGGIPPKRIRVLKNIPTLSQTSIVDREAVKKKLGIPAGAKVIGFVGRLERVKGIAQFIQAALALISEGESVHFVVIGDGSERAAMEGLVSAHGAASNIRFLGFLTDPVEIFSSLDVYVLSSLSEGIPLTLLEAMNMGVPVIATAVGGVPEVVKDGVNGILVPPDDINALVKAIKLVLDCNTHREKMIAEARKNIGETYDMMTWIRKIEEMYLSESQ